jgi:hypothetical protein
MQIRYRFGRLLDVIRNSIWARNQERIWRTKASVDQLNQIIDRLEMGVSTPDQRAALNLARMLRKRLGA